MIQYIKGDLFSHKASKNYINILVHACNCKGSWGAGVAAKFATEYPQCYKIHRQYCQQFKQNSSQLLGTSQIIESNETEPGHKQLGQSLVVCLFTSDFFGHKKLSSQEIVHYTKLSLQDLLDKLHNYSGWDKLDRVDGQVVLNMPKINSGLFGVPWEQTEDILKRVEFHSNVYVID